MTPFFLFFTLAYGQVSDVIDTMINGSSSLADSSVQYYGDDLNAQQIRERGFDAMQSGKDLVFSIHDMFEGFLLAVSPIDLDPTFYTIILTVGAVLLVYAVLKRVGKHLIWFALGFGALIAVLMFLGINPDF